MRLRYGAGVTRKLSISLPDDVAEFLDGVDNASAYIAEAIRADIGRRQFRAMLARHGHPVTDEGVAAAGARLRAAQARRDAAKAAKAARAVQGARGKAA
jgi:hypothetical protein